MHGYQINENDCYSSLKQVIVAYIYLCTNAKFSVEKSRHQSSESIDSECLEGVHQHSRVVDCRSHDRELLLPSHAKNSVPHYNKPTMKLMKARDE